MERDHDKKHVLDEDTEKRSILDQVGRFLGFRDFTPTVRKKMNGANLIKGIPVIVIDGVTSLIRLIVLIMTPQVTLEYARSITIYAFLLFGALIFAYAIWLFYKKESEDQKKITRIIYLFLAFHLCYGFEMSMDLFDTGVPGSCHCISL